MNHPPKDENLRCSFCAKGRDEVTALIAGPQNVFICDECTELCMDMVRESRGKPIGPAQTYRPFVERRIAIIDREATQIREQPDEAIADLLRTRDSLTASLELLEPPANLR